MAYKFYVNGRFKASCREERVAQITEYLEKRYPGQNIEMKEIEYRDIIVDKELIEKELKEFLKQLD